MDELSAVLEGVDFRAVVIGGVAYNFWREPRYTKDIDFAITADRDLIASVTQRLLDDGYVVTRRQGGDADTSGPDFLRLTKPGTPNVVEFQGAKTPYQDLVISRGYRGDRSQPFAMATPEDLIVLKLIANRSKDHSDVSQLALMDGLDWEYIAHWATVWQVTGRLEGLQLRTANERQRRKDLDT